MQCTPHAIRTRRAVLAVSQRELAKRSSVKQPLLSAIESGKRLPTASVSKAIEEHLQVRPSAVLAFYRQQVRDKVGAHRGKCVSIFGSVARGTDTVDSDLDLLVEFEEGTDICDLLALEEELSELLTVPVDVVSAGSQSDFVQGIRSEAVPL